MHMNTNEIDVICQMKHTGEVIPLRIRLQDSDGQYHNFNIKGYRPLSREGTYTSPDGIMCTCYIKVYECKVEVFGSEIVVRLYYDKSKSEWRMIA